MLNPIRKQLLIALTGYFLAASALAETTAKSTPVAVSTGDMMTVFLGLGLVLVLIFGCAWLVRRMTGLQAAGNGAIKIVSVLPVGTRERIALVEVGGKQLLVGVTANQITTLHSFDEPVVDAPQVKNNSEFAQKLHQLMSRH